MQLQRTTWILLLTACLMGGAIYLYEGVGSEQREAAETATKRLFPINTEDEVTQVTLSTPQYTLSLNRIPTLANPTPTAMVSPSPVASGTPTATPTVMPPSPEWNIRVQGAEGDKSMAEPANDATVDFLVNLLVTSERQPLSPDKPKRNVLTIPVNEKVKFGLDKPIATVDLTLENGTTHQLLLGQPNFNRSALYAQTDPESATGELIQIALVPLTFENAVQRPLEEWYPSEVTSTPTPSP